MCVPKKCWNGLAKRCQWSLFLGVMTLLGITGIGIPTVYADIETTWGSNWGEMVYWESGAGDSSTWIVGEAIEPPAEADVTQKPLLGDSDGDFFWSTVEQKLYPIAPGSTVVHWHDGTGGTIPVIGNHVWPSAPQIHVAGTPAVKLLPSDSTLGYVENVYSNAASVGISAQMEFTNTSLGYTVLLYAQASPATDAPVFEVIRTVEWNSSNLVEANWNIAQHITDGAHNTTCGQGYVVNNLSTHAINTQAETPYDGYKADEQTGPIVAVNTDKTPADDSDDLAVVWYQKGAQTQVCWPFKPVRYTPQWPNFNKIIIAQQTGSGVLPPENYLNPAVYEQTDTNISGYNPNEEHALIFPAQGGGGMAIFALRDDLNTSATSEPYAILKYQKPSDSNNWHYRAYQVVREESPYMLQYSGTAGTVIQPPYPLSDFQVCEGSEGVSGPYWEDSKGYLWARAAGLDGNATDIVTRFYENWQGTCTPWLDDGTGVPDDVTFTVSWPDVPELYVAETLISEKNGLPNVTNQCSVEVIFDQHQALTDPANSSVKLINPVTERQVDLSVLPDSIATRNVAGKLHFLDLPYHLQSRITYDPINLKLELTGMIDDAGVGEPLVLLNILSTREKDQLLSLSGNASYQLAVEALYEESRNQLDGQTLLVGGDKALTAGSATGTGYVTLAMQNDFDGCNPLPISLEIIKVVPQLYKGEIKVIKPEDVFDERVTLRHNGDFGGVPDPRVFEWRTLPDTNGTPPIYDPSGDNTNWTLFTTVPANGAGSLDITIEGPGLNTLKDKWFITRYKGYSVVGAETWSEWTSPQLYEGWIKRVTQGLNPFEQRAKDFHTTEVNTFSSMIIQAGERYEGNVALNGDPNNVNSFGLIELYDTVLHRGKALSIEGLPPVDDPGANQALLLAAGRIADLYMLLGNEAFADAMDPTIGFGTQHGQYGSEASSLFSFKNQVPSLLEEELALLRGRDDTGGTAVNVKPLFNRLPWNFTSGINGGEVAYSVNYNLEDQNDNGALDEFDAKIMFPQGHGDSWGHYLSAIKAYYGLLRNPNYTWQPRAESVLVAGLPVQVDYLDERKFAQAAAAKARTGAEIMNLTYRQRYLEDPTKQWQGYKDENIDRAWGLDEWASRAGEGAYFDWITANAMVPPEDTTNTGIAKVDRDTVVELREISSQFSIIQAVVDKANIGLNPVGLVTDAVPFDIDPTQISNGKTHFEQIYERAVQALQNTITLFDHASQNTQRLRGQEDSLEKFQDNVAEREADFKNRLIEIYGYPYPDDIGPGGTYPEGYDGPDLYHHMYVDPSELMGVNPQLTESYTINFKNLAAASDGSLSSSIQSVEFNLSTNGLGLIKPAHWDERRRAPGRLQMARSDLLQSKSRFDQGIVKYNNLIKQIEDQASLIRARHNMAENEIKIFEKRNEANIAQNGVLLTGSANQREAFRIKSAGLQNAIVNAHKKSQDALRQASVSQQTANMLAEALPTVIGGGLAVVTDPSFLARGTFLASGIDSWLTHSELAGQFTIQELEAGNNLSEEQARYQYNQSKAQMESQNAKEINSNLAEIDLLILRNNFSVEQEVARMEQLIREEAAIRLELLSFQENMQQLTGRYLSTLAEGERVLQEQLRFRKKTAGDIQDYRYQDMAFRIFRNDALQKYRAQFEMTAMYVYLAAKAYDFETNLLDSDNLAGQQFLADIVKERAIGSMDGGIPNLGSGLADILARLNQNFMVLKGQLGFTNPQTETNRFSLRKELFRIRQGVSSNANWKQTLQEHWIPNLWDIKEFRRYARPFASDDTIQPGLVIPMSTNITSGLNFFGQILGGGDSFYSPTNFATKVRSVGVWFSNYNTLGITETPRVYLIPVGLDVLRSPTGNTLETREWQVVDQRLPIPFPIGDLSGQPGWLPIADSLSGELSEVRRHSDFRAYHDGGSFNQAEMTYDSRLIGRSVWNTRWLLIIPGASLHGDPEEGLNTLIYGPKISGTENRTGNGVTDIKIFFQTYAYSGN